MRTARDHRLTPEEYLAQERRAEWKSEYLDGEVFAMVCASRRHNVISLNVASSLLAQVRGRGCEVYASDMRVRIPATNLYTYPDVTVVCGRPSFDDGELDTLLNPKLIVEVLSATTEGYDRGKKFAHYRTLESLAEYVLITQEEVRVERFSRQPDGLWVLAEADRMEDILPLPSIGCELRLADVYDGAFGPRPA
jgi:Uma2 family endonuclease